MKTLLIASGLALAFGDAQAITLDFGSGPTAPTICSRLIDGSGALAPCVDNGLVNQAYGDVAGVVDVTYYSNPARAMPPSLHWWSENYNDLYGVLWAYEGGDAGSYARIELKPLGSEGITLSGFDFGAYSNTRRGTFIDVYAISSTTPLFHYEGDVGSPPNHTSFAVNVSSANGLWIDWQNSAYNVGIDNVTFSVQAVPEPQTYALVLGGLGLLATVVRRSRR